MPWRARESRDPQAPGGETGVRASAAGRAEFVALGQHKGGDARPQDKEPAGPAVAPGGGTTRGCGAPPRRPGPEVSPTAPPAGRSPRPSQRLPPLVRARPASRSAVPGLRPPFPRRRRRALHLLLAAERAASGRACRRPPLPSPPFPAALACEARGWLATAMEAAGGASPQDVCGGVLSPVRRCLPSRPRVSDGNRVTTA